MGENSNYLNFIQRKGIALSEINPGSNEYALKLYDVLSAIELLEISETAVLGGDILSDESGKLRYTYENWYCQRQDNEEDADYSKRSCLIAREYINKLINREDDENQYAVLVI